jgi:hypothetical protein
MKIRYATKKFVYHPVNHWPHAVPSILSPGIRIAPAPTIPDEKNSIIRFSLGEHAIETLKACPCWICFEFFDESVSGTVRQERAVELVRNTQLAIQIVQPTGLWDGTIFVFEERGNKIDVIQIAQKPRMDTTVWAKMSGPYHSSLSEVKCVVRGVNAAFKGNVTRLVNPLYFLELGLEATNIHMRIFLWVTALDSLLMAGESHVFVERLGNLLDEDSFVFPPISGFEQPKYLVSDVAKDLYELRSKIAHGLEIPKKFTRICGFKDTEEQDILGYDPSHQYRQILHESAFLLLVRALKVNFLEDRMAQVASTNDWRRRLRRPF